VIAGVNRSTAERQNRAFWGPRRCASQNQGQRRIISLSGLTTLILLLYDLPQRHQQLLHFFHRVVVHEAYAQKSSLSLYI
jgi:hypothetical protein